MEPLFLQPVFQEKIWGGTNLRQQFDYPITSPKTGECWAISAHPNGPSLIENGPYQGQTLAELWQNQPALFGYPSQKVFPLLTKIIDAQSDLSVQVHPDDLYAQAHEGELGKTECWYVLAAEPGAEIIYGHNARTQTELRQWVEEGDWQSLLRRQTVQAGDFIYVPSGTIHALGRGIMVLETQQSSDTTYRLYDYDRLDAEGQPRQLHTKQALDVTTVPFEAETPEPEITMLANTQKKRLIASPFFTVNHYQVPDTLTLSLTSPYSLISVLAGQGTIRWLAEGEATPRIVQKGQHFILPASIRQIDFKGQLELLITDPPQ